VVEGQRSPLRIWLDLANSPHPLVFAPVVRRLEARGHEVVVTVRDNAQTVELSRAYWPSCAVIGSESPARPAAKAATLGRRARALAGWAQDRQLDVALSHNSYAQIVAARMRGISIVTAADFEHQPANQLAFRLATCILMPEVLRETNIRRQGASRRKTVFYPGLKEELYIGDFEPDREILSRLGIERSPDEAVVVTRTPPTRAIYHRFPNPLFVDTLIALDKEPNVRLIVLARHPEQRAAIEALQLRKCQMPTHAVDARSLMYSADLVIGAGGTMTREAALLAVPTLSVFSGSQPAVERWLEQRGMLRRIRSPKDVVPVRPRPAEPRPTQELLRRGSELIDIFLDTIEAAARDGAGRAPERPSSNRTPTAS
jgi:predicted glycosyltransferase